MARILHLIASESVGGAEKQLVHHARDTRDADYQIVLGSFQDDAETPEFLALARRHGVETVSIPGGIRPGLVDDLTNYLVEHRIRLLCTHGYKANVVGHFGARNAGVPWVPFVHGFTGETWQVSLYERLERNLLLRSPWVVCTSPAQARELGRARRGKRAPMVIQNAVLAPRETSRTQEDAVPSREELGWTDRDFIFGAVGCFRRDKGHHLLMEAFALLQKMLPDEALHLLLLGEGREEASLRSLTRKLAIEPRVRFAGYQPRPGPWMRMMDCLVHPSSAEGTPSSVLEAMCLGLPVIATAVGGVPEVTDNGRAGLLIEPGSIAAMADAMKKMVRSESMRRQYAVAARRHVEQAFSPVRQRELLEHLYGVFLRNVSRVGDEDRLHVVA